MSRRGRKSDYAILIAVGTVTVLVILGFVWGGLLEEDDGTDYCVRTTRSAKPEGTLACYMLYERIGWRPERLERPLIAEHLVGLELLFVIDPIFQIQPHEVRALRQWVSRGGVLVCTGDVEKRIQEGLSGEERITRRRAGYSRWASVRDSADDRSPTGVPDVSGDLPLARDVTEALLTTRSRIDPDEFKDERGVRGVTELFVDTAGCRIAERKIGKGKAIVLADASFLANKRLARYDNSILAANLAAYSLVGSSSGTIVFDEYHFGYGGRESGWTAISAALFKTSAGWAVLVVAASGLCLLIYKGRRFGTRVSPSRTRRRSKLEYVRSVGATYRAAGAHKLAFQLIYKSVLNNAAKLVGMPESASPSQIADRLVTRAGTSPRKYQTSFEMCQKALQAKRLSGRRFATLVQRLGEIESEMMNGHSESKRAVASSAR